MDMFMIPVPMFNAKMEVAAYRFFTHRGNEFALQVGAASGSAVLEPVLDLLGGDGLEAFVMDKAAFVPIGPVTLLSRLEDRLDENVRRRVVFLLGPDTPSTLAHVESLERHVENGFRFGMAGIANPLDYRRLLQLCRYWLIDQTDDPSPWPRRMPPDIRHLILTATNVTDHAMFAELVQDGMYSLFEGGFYRYPVTMGKNRVSPVKVNLIRMLNMVQDPDFDFRKLADIIQRDTALSISLLKLVNSPYFKRTREIGSIGQAVALLGEIEIRKWASTAVSLIMGTDKPDEITRLSLIRAKFAENLAVSFGLALYSQSLFLTGLFSVLDIVLEATMREALEMVKVSGVIHQALVEGTGMFAPVLEIVRRYEAAEWQELSRLLILHDLSAASVADAYIDAAAWYRDLIFEARQEAARLIAAQEQEKLEKQEKHDKETAG